MVSINLYHVVPLVFFVCACTCKEESRYVASLQRSKKHDLPSLDPRFGFFGSRPYLNQIFPNERPLVSSQIIYPGPYYNQRPTYNDRVNYFTPDYDLYPHQHQKPQHNHQYHNYPYQKPYHHYPLEYTDQDYSNYDTYPEYPDISEQTPPRPVPPVESEGTTTERVSILGKPVFVQPATRPPDEIIFNNNSTDTGEQRQCVQDCPTNSEYDPVCGTNNMTYFNPGKFKCARDCGVDVYIKQKGRCPGPTSQSGGF